MSKPDGLTHAPPAGLLRSAGVVLALAAFALTLFGFAACGAGEDPTGVPPQDAPLGSLPLFSESLTEGGPVPVQLTCDGADISPHLRWGEPPPETKSLAVVMDDPDAPRGVFYHWLVFDIPGNVRAIPAGAPKTDRLDNGAAQGRNDFGSIGYRGPCPPKGSPHEYRVFVYALDKELKLAPGVKAPEMLAAMRGHVQAVGKLSASYQR
jgi:hypothetical protein